MVNFLDPDNGFFGRNWVFLDYSSHVLWHLPKWTGIHPWRIYDQSTDLRMESGALVGGEGEEMGRRKKRGRGRGGGEEKEEGKRRWTRKRSG